MRAHSHLSLWTLAPWLLLACSSGRDVAIDPVSANDSADPDPDGAEQPGTQRAALGRALFPGAGTSGAAQPLSPGLGPESITQCGPTPSSAASPGVSVQTVCFYGEDDLEVPAAAIEQLVEIVGNDEWVHIRLTLNPSFVDNTYGENAIGWDAREAALDAPDAPEPGAGAPGAPASGEPPLGAPPPDAPAPPDAPPPPPAPNAAGLDAGAPPAAPPAPPAADAAAGPPPRPERPAPGEAPAPNAGPRADAPTPPDDEPREPRRDERGPRPGRGGHSFDDLLGSDHAELTLLDANGDVAMQFRIDYVSAAEAATSGYASLGVAGGEGRLITGDLAHVLGSTTSIDRNLNACGLDAFTESSPATDALYTPNPDASDWDYRVSYEIWIAKAAFGSAGFGSALIDNVHASPSKAPGNSIDVLPAPCPSDPEQPEVEPAPLPAVLQTIR